jgi:hypothetical protein
LEGGRDERLEKIVKIIWMKNQEVCGGWSRWRAYKTGNSETN